MKNLGMFEGKSEKCTGIYTVVEMDLLTPSRRRW